MRLGAKTRAVLQRMLDRRDSEDEDGILVQSIPGGWWLGDEQVDGRIGHMLVRLVLIRQLDFGRDGYHSYVINEEGVKTLQDASYIPLIAPHLLARLG